MSQNLKATDLNLLVSLSCPNPQWEHVKFSFEDSPREVDRYYGTMQCGNSHMHRLHERDEGVVLLIKAELVADKRYPKVVLYERVLSSDLDDTEELKRMWKYHTERLGFKMSEELEDHIIISSKLENEPYNKRVMVEYSLVDLRYYGNQVRRRYLVGTGYPYRHSNYNSGDNIFEVIQTQAMNDLLKSGVKPDYLNINISY